MSLTGPEIESKSGKTRQLVIFLHGYGADGNDLISLSNEFAEILPDAHFVSPHAPEACEMSPFGFQWFSLASRDLIYMTKGAETAEEILNEFIDEKLKELKLTEENLVIIGFSQGSMMAMFASIRRAKPAAAVIGYSGAFLHDEKMDNQIKSKPKICLIHGTDDQVVPFSSLLDAKKKLTKLGFDAEFHQRPHLGHGIDFEGIQIAKDFLKKMFL